MKTWYTSKTLWANLVALIALALQSHYGYVLDPEIQAYILGFVNLVLRMITNQPLDWKPTVSNNDVAGYIKSQLMYGLLLLIIFVTMVMANGCAYNSITVTAQGNVNVTGSVDKPVSVDTARGLGQGATLSAVPGL